MVGWMGAMLRISKTKQLCNFYVDAYSASITGGAMINAFYWAQKKKADRYVMLALIEAVFNGGHRNDWTSRNWRKKNQKKKTTDGSVMGPSTTDCFCAQYWG